MAGALLPSVVWANTPHLNSLIDRVAAEEGMDPALLRAVVQAESAFQPHAISPKGAVGLMQLMPDTARELGVRNRYNPEQNLRGGARYLRQLLLKFSSLKLALAAYNAGPGAVAQYRGIPPYAETRQYVHKILSLYGKKGHALGKRSNAFSRPKPLNKTIYRYRTANGTLVLTDTHPMYSSTKPGSRNSGKGRKDKKAGDTFASLPKPKGQIRILRIVSSQ